MRWLYHDHPDSLLRNEFYRRVLQRFANLKSGRTPDRFPDFARLEDDVQIAYALGDEIKRKE